MSDRTTAGPPATEHPQERGARLGARESLRVRRSAEAGFTLLEAVVAVMIVGLAVVSSLAAFGAQLRAADRARIALEAEALAQERLSALVLAQSAAVRSLPDSLRSGEFTPPFDRYRWEAAAHSVRGEPDLFDVSTSVLWDGGSYQLDSRLYRPLPVIRNP